MDPKNGGTEHAQTHGQALLLVYVHEPAQDAATAWGFARMGMHRKRFVADTLQDLAQVMGDASICGLGQAAPNPIRCVLEYFPHEVGAEVKA